MVKLDQDVIFLNKIAQGKEAISSGVKLYDDLSEEEKNALYSVLEFCLMQSKPTKEMIDKGIELAKPKYPSISIKPIQNHFMVFAPKSPEEERESFVFMLYIFKESDTMRRKTFCKYGCSHAWHNLE